MYMYKKYEIHNLRMKYNTYNLNIFVANTICFLNWDGLPPAAPLEFIPDCLVTINQDMLIKFTV